MGHQEMHPSNLKPFRGIWNRFNSSFSLLSERAESLHRPATMRIQITFKLLLWSFTAGRFPPNSGSHGNLGADTNSSAFPKVRYYRQEKMWREQHPPCRSPELLCPAALEPRAINYLEVTFLVNGFNFCFYVRRGNGVIYSTTYCCWFSHRDLGLLSDFFFFLLLTH